MVVDAKNIQLGQKDDRWTGTLEILFVEQGAADRQPMVIGDAMAVNLKKDTYTRRCSEAWCWRRIWKWPTRGIS